jgi:hypothetical protein
MGFFTTASLKWLTTAGGKHATETFVKGLLLRVCCRPAEEHGDDCGDLQSEMLHETTP